MFMQELARRCALMVPALFTPASFADTAHLTFAWPPGIDATITFEGDRVRTLGERSQRTLTRGSFRLTSEQVDDGLALRYSEFTLEPGGAGPANGPQKALQTLMMRVGSAVPEAVVGPDGAIVRFVGTDALIAEFRSAFAELSRAMPPAARPQIERMLGQLLSNDVLERRMADDWNRDVGTWAGAELDHGERYVHETSEPAPLLGNAMVPMTVTFEYLGPTPCTEGDGEPRCASLRMISAVDEAQIGDALAGFIQRLAAAGTAAPEIRDLRMETTVSLTTEPATLLPHAVTVRKVTSMTVVSEGRVQETQQAQRQIYHYAYH